MLLTYVDESYTDGWFVMAALLVDGPEAVTLTDELDRVATAAAKARRRPTAWVPEWSCTGTRSSMAAGRGRECRFVPESASSTMSSRRSPRGMSE